MIKLLSAISLLLLLTACGSQTESKEATLEKETTHNSVKEQQTVQEHHEKVTTATPPQKVLKEEAPKTEKRATPSPESTPQPTEAYAKNIFTLTTIDGKALHVDEVEEGVVFQEHKGKVVFLLFFGYRCPPCLAEIPALNAMTAEKHDDMEIIAIEVQRCQTLESFKKDKSIKYTLLSGDVGQNEQFISYIGQRAQWGGSIPFLVALNPQGEVKVVHVGGMVSSQFKTIYEKLRLEK